MAKVSAGVPAKHLTIEVNGSHEPSPPGHSNMIMSVDGKEHRFKNVGGTHQVAGAIAVLIAIRQADEQGVTHLTLTSPSDRIHEHHVEKWDRKDDFLAHLHWVIESFRSHFDDLII